MGRWASVGRGLFVAGGGRGRDAFEGVVGGWCVAWDVCFIARQRLLIENHSNTGLRVCSLARSTIEREVKANGEWVERVAKTGMTRSREGVGKET